MLLVCTLQKQVTESEIGLIYIFIESHIEPMHLLQLLIKPLKTNYKKSLQ